MKTIKELCRGGNDILKCQIILQNWAKGWIEQLSKLEQIDVWKISTEEREKVYDDYYCIFDAVGAYDNSNLIDWIEKVFNLKEVE